MTIRFMEEPGGLSSSLEDGTSPFGYLIRKKKAGSTGMELSGVVEHQPSPRRILLALEHDSSMKQAKTPSINFFSEVLASRALQNIGVSSSWKRKRTKPSQQPAKL